MAESIWTADRKKTDFSTYAIKFQTSAASVASLFEHWPTAEVGLGQPLASTGQANDWFLRLFDYRMLDVSPEGNHCLSRALLRSIGMPEAYARTLRLLLAVHIVLFPDQHCRSLDGHVQSLLTDGEPLDYSVCQAFATVARRPVLLLNASASPEAGVSNPSHLFTPAMPAAARMWPTYRPSVITWATPGRSGHFMAVCPAPAPKVVPPQLYRCLPWSTSMPPRGGLSRLATPAECGLGEPPRGMPDATSKDNVNDGM